MTEILAITRAGDICLTVFLFLVGLVLIIKGGDWFVDSASKIAEMSGVPQFIIGATVVSIGTTLPELITSSIAAGEGNAAIAIGNAVGSVNANIGLIMAVSLLFLPHAFDKKAYLFKGITMILSIVILFLMCLKGYLNAYLSIILLVVFVVFMAENIIVGKKEATKNKLVDNGTNPASVNANGNPAESENATAESTNTDALAAKKQKTKDIAKSIIFFILGTAFIVGGAQHLGGDKFYCYEQTSSTKDDGYQYKVLTKPEEEEIDKRYTYYKISVWTYDMKSGAKTLIVPDRIFSTIVNKYYKKSVGRDL